jgi:hypothetical protein
MKFESFNDGTLRPYVRDQRGLASPMRLKIWFNGEDDPIDARMDMDVENADALGILLSQARWIAVDGGRLVNLANVRVIQLVSPNETA